MAELRLIPAAVVTWGGLVVLILAGSVWWAAGFIAMSAAIIALKAWWGQCVLVAGIASTTLITSSVRMSLAHRAAERLNAARAWTGRIAALPRPTNTGNTLVTMHVRGYPEPLAVFAQGEPAGWAPGALVAVEGKLVESDRPSLGGHIARGDLAVIRPPQGTAAWSEHLRNNLHLAVDQAIAGEHKGLIPGMVLGDTSLQTQQAQELYRLTGLAHLSAVSGANVAVLTTCAVLICRALGLGPRIQTASCLSVLVGFVVIVGPEPSVIRAGITGVVGLIAVVASSRMQPLHALGLAVISVMAIYPSMAVDLGFLLSVVATVGIVAVSPVLARPLIKRGMPDVVARAIAVALAADAATLPVVAAMSGQASLVSAFANLLVAPAAGPITVVGVVATLVAAVHPLLAQPAVLVINPLAWWIHSVAFWAGQRSLVTIMAPAHHVALIYGWIFAGLMRWPRATGVVVIVGWCLVVRPWA
ncbi:ComEC/Rec2 family competence protein [Corynebacterium tapiri]|uniref:ComEC/Rec2 family competence protein n=1 Tax=Corynebacterium tapiri TaxID=1448266 RepID=A0A5C4U2L0_9CORY|nr:ComEC/Rec2 family competence protein [Corynebacterium tapiri]TNL96626.1 ComEC/Rec2 family competence protein [Corynebacterium tapiri]